MRSCDNPGLRSVTLERSMEDAVTFRQRSGVTAFTLETRTQPRARCLPLALQTTRHAGQDPRLRAAPLFKMIRGRGYAESVVQLRGVVRTLRPAGTLLTLYRRLTTLPAED